MISKSPYYFCNAWENVYRPPPTNFVTKMVGRPFSDWIAMGGHPSNFHMHFMGHLPKYSIVGKKGTHPFLNFDNVTLVKGFNEHCMNIRWTQWRGSMKRPFFSEPAYVWSFCWKKVVKTTFFFRFRPWMKKFLKISKNSQKSEKWMFLKIICLWETIFRKIIFF